MLVTHSFWLLVDVVDWKFKLMMSQSWQLTFIHICRFEQVLTLHLTGCLNQVVMEWKVDGLTCCQVNNPLHFFMWTPNVPPFQSANTYSSKKKSKAWVLSPTQVLRLISTAQTNCMKAAIHLYVLRKLAGSTGGTVDSPFSSMMFDTVPETMSWPDWPHRLSFNPKCATTLAVRLSSNLTYPLFKKYNSLFGIKLQLSSVMYMIKMTKEELPTKNLARRITWASSMDNWNKSNAQRNRKPHEPKDTISSRTLFMVTHYG